MLSKMAYAVIDTRCGHVAAATMMEIVARHHVGLLLQGGVIGCEVRELTEPVRDEQRPTQDCERCAERVTALQVAAYRVQVLTIADLHGLDTVAVGSFFNELVDRQCSMGHQLDAHAAGHATETAIRIGLFPKAQDMDLDPSMFTGEV